ncbi:hypothetical protein ZOSMA_162G00190 [Zostera marina]|uniref:GATA-type domain-containing protein n=1 Tax=Zostera marina TaxID=29655 RepID=A0A0K9PU67_ZOSMR|nr:hypothetical protein ZOSMA_162G00190 [Zostera marina]
MMKSADYYSGKASADDGKQISLLPNPSSIPAHQSISNQQRLIDDDKDRDKDNCIVVENGPPLPPPALPSVSPSSSSSSSMNTGSKAPIIISNSSGIFTTLTNRGRAPRTKRRKFIPKHPLNKRPVDFPIPALECDITEERQSKKLKTVHPSSTSVEINLPPTPSSQPHLVPCQKDEETIRNCSHCRAVVTPQWRPMGPKTLCNACGVPPNPSRVPRNRNRGSAELDRGSAELDRGSAELDRGSAELDFDSAEPIANLRGTSARRTEQRPSGWRGTSDFDSMNGREFFGKMDGRI